MLWLLMSGGLAATLLGGYFVWLGGLAFCQPPAFPAQLPPTPPLRGDALKLGEDGRWYANGPFAGVHVPHTYPAAWVQIGDDLEVLGVCVNGRPRAYLLAALGFPTHVVNDLIAGQPVSVTYCGKTDCSRVFTSGLAGQPLALSVSGWGGSKGMKLRLDGVDYAQQTGENLTTPGGAPFPQRDLAFERTTWGAWRKVHPDTDIYTGDASDEIIPGG
jgi:hypothetical protein